jgi:thymidylate kinase
LTEQGVNLVNFDLAKKKQSLKSTVQRDFTTFSNMAGSLFIFEGPDGVGKTSVMEAVFLKLVQYNLKIKKYYFPGKESGTLGKHINNLYSDSSQIDINGINPASLQLLHIAAHIDSITNRIIPSLEENYIVLLDRYWWSAYVYGKVDNVNVENLKLMIQLEKKYWGSVAQKKVFLFKRSNASFNENIDRKKWNRLIEEYDMLAEKEKLIYPVGVIKNMGRLNETVEICLNEILRIIRG